MGDTPMSFVCPVARKTQRFDIDGYMESGRRGVRDFYRYPRGHETILRTGRTKPNPSHRRSARTADRVHEFVCQCGHRGWSKHRDIVRHPLMHFGMPHGGWRVTWDRDNAQRIVRKFA